jgi:hypothetical protein
MRGAALLIAAALVACALAAAQPRASSNCAPVAAFPLLVTDDNACFHLTADIEWHHNGPFILWEGARGELQFRGFRIRTHGFCSAGIEVFGPNAALTVFDLHVESLYTLFCGNSYALQVYDGATLAVYNGYVANMYAGVLAGVDATFVTETFYVYSMTFQGIICGDVVQCSLKDVHVVDAPIGISIGGRNSELTASTVWVGFIYGIYINATGPVLLTDVEVSGAATVNIFVDFAYVVNMQNLVTLQEGNNYPAIEVDGVSSLLISTWTATGGAAALVADGGATGQIVVTGASTHRSYYGLWMGADSVKVDWRSSTFSGHCLAVYMDISTAGLVLRDDDFLDNAVATQLDGSNVVTLDNVNTGDTASCTLPVPPF